MRWNIVWFWPPAQSSSTVWPCGSPYTKTKSGYFFFSSKSRGLIIHASITTPFPMSSFRNSVGRVISGAARLRTSSFDFQDPFRVMVGESDQVDDRRRVEGGIGVERPLPIRREVVAVRSGLVRRRHPFGIALAIEPDAIQVALGRVRRRREVVKPAAVLVDRPAGDDVGLVLRQERPLFAVSRDHVGLPPAVALAEQDEFLAVANPLQPGIGGIARVDPRGIGFLVRRRDFSGLDVGEQELAVVAGSAEHFDQQFLRVPGPTDVVDVKRTRIGRQFHPPSGPALAIRRRPREGSESACRRGRTVRVSPRDTSGRSAGSPAECEPSRNRIGRTRSDGRRGSNSGRRCPVGCGRRPRSTA